MSAVLMTKIIIIIIFT